MSTSPPLYPVLPSAGPPKHWLPDATFYPHQPNKYRYRCHLLPDDREPDSKQTVPPAELIIDIDLHSDIFQIGVKDRGF